jgi:hypothetical protein
MTACAPEATVMPVVDIGAAAEQTALPALAVAAVQVAVMADAGMVVHPENVDVPDEMARVQLEALPRNKLKLVTEEADPATVPKSGSVAEKVMVLGVTVMPVMNNALADLVPVPAGAVLFWPDLPCPAARVVAITKAITKV